jgi:RNA polymerase sigma-70 factor (ECF subfamily)
MHSAALTSGGTISSVRGPAGLLFCPVMRKGQKRWAILSRPRFSLEKYLSVDGSGRIGQNIDTKSGNDMPEHEVTELLSRFRAGDREAQSRLLPLVYSELRRLAFACLNRERRDHTLEPTALVHEVFLRLTRGGQPAWQDRAHFLGVASRLMRQILVDYARRHRARKRGGSRERVSLLDSVVVSREKSDELLLLDQALGRLAEQDERQSRIVEMKFFGGLGVEEIAEVLQLSPRTVKREWMMARAWLHREICR